MGSYHIIAKFKMTEKSCSSKLKSLSDISSQFIHLRHRSKSAKPTPLRGYWSLQLNFLDEKLAIRGFEDNSQISFIVELPFIIWKTPSDKLSHRKKLLNSLIFFSKLAHKNTNLTIRHFLIFRPQTRNIIFLRTQEKNFEKRASIFESMLKKSN